jgi:peptide alpha-N-acetyltransferase
MMQEYFDADYVTLQVRVSNRPAIHLYQNNLGFHISSIEKEYYDDREDAYKMRKYFKKEKKDKNIVSIEIKDEIKYDEIKDYFEKVDADGNPIKEKIENEKNDGKSENKDNKDKKKKRNKKKH